MLCNGTWGQEEEEEDVEVNTTEGGIGEAKEGGGAITGAPMVATLALNRDATMVDESATTERAEAVTPKFSSWNSLLNMHGGRRRKSKSNNNDFSRNKDCNNDKGKNFSWHTNSGHEGLNAPSTSYNPTP